ncbi:uncharacterized protein LOC113468364 [Diaphorina citri]|uniref:Uncharacterized protein LOC113468364 n=1 Tax=Diaphorina citri TaxID=121845 RepID=A0A3Q0IXM3_DIACI|nr:uncharacterized protein LOC113468364 [Diaphorina citri]
MESVQVYLVCDVKECCPAFLPSCLRREFCPSLDYRYTGRHISVVVVERRHPGSNADLQLPEHKDEGLSTQQHPAKTDWYNMGSLTSPAPHIHNCAQPLRCRVRCPCVEVIRPLQTSQYRHQRILPNHHRLPQADSSR